MGMQDKADPQVVEGLVLMRAFFKIADAADRRKVIDLASTLASSKYPDAPSSPSLPDWPQNEQRGPLGT